MGFLPLTEAQRERANNRLAVFAAAGIEPDMAQVARGARLPDGLVQQDGVAMFWCRGCEAYREWIADPEDYDDSNPANLCGGSPRCIP